MAILFEFYESPTTEGQEEVQYHARTVNYHTINTDTLASEIQQESSLTAADVKGVLVALSRKLAHHLGNSEKVHLEGIGYFNTTLKTSRKIEQEKTRAQSVWFKSVSFRADQDLKNQLKGAPTMRSEIKRHSDKLTDEEIDRKVFKYLENNPFITRKKIEALCNLRPTTAGRQLARLIEEGKLKNINTRRQPFYVKG